MQRSLPLAAAMLVGAAPIVLAQREQVFDWSGRVDREVQITMRGNSLTTRVIGKDVGRERSRVMNPLPRMDGELTVQLLNGRGTADVIEQPSARNGYTAVVRIQDAKSGDDFYRVAGYWRSFDNGRPGMDRGADRGMDRGMERGRGMGRGMSDQTLLHWSGNVDGELEIRIRNGRVTYRNISGASPTGIRVAEGRGASRTGGLVNISQSQGRGSVRVIQQPNYRNGYTTIIRVNDPQGGFGYYDFDVFWQ